MSKPTEVFTIHGVEPEVLAYAMAKYSRSALSMKESLRDISSQKASDFMNTFYFQYGHKSIADMAHIPMALENISLLAAIEVVDEQRWDGQERSTRYQDFTNREHYTPTGLYQIEENVFEQGIDGLFDAYAALTEKYFNHLTLIHAKPEGWTQDKYERTLKAHAFDVARYLLPLATNTSVGQVTSARSLEGQISRLMSSDYGELRALASKMTLALASPAFQLNAEAPEVRSSQTLVKYANSNDYLIKERETIRAAAEKLLGSADETHPGRVFDVELHIGVDPITELIATLIYGVTNRRFGNLVHALSDRGGLGQISRDAKEKFIDTVVGDRGQFDELSRNWRVGNGFIFEINMDIGGFRDMHRHRRCIQVFKDYNNYEYAIPEPLLGEGLEDLRAIYESAIDGAAHVRNAFFHLLRSKGASGSDADYLIPLGFKRRFLMKMDLAELTYITELRTGAAGHFSYRKIAYRMWQELHRQAPSLAKHIRVTPYGPTEVFKR